MGSEDSARQSFLVLNNSLFPFIEIFSLQNELGNPCEAMAEEIIKNNEPGNPEEALAKEIIKNNEPGNPEEALAEEIMKHLLAWQP